MDTNTIARGVAKLRTIGVYDNDAIFGNQATKISQWASRHGVGVYDPNLMYTQYHYRAGFSCECGCQSA